MSIEVVNTASALTITEQSGDRRSVRLVARALPYRPFNLRTKQRNEITWLPGNPEGTATLLGAAEDPTSMTGWWKDKYLGTSVRVSDGRVSGATSYPMTVDEAPVTDVRAAMVLFDDICRKGQLLQVTWDEQIRMGHLVEFDKNIHNRHDIEYSLEFVWISRGEATAPSVFTTETTVSDTVSTLEEQNQTLQLSTKADFPVSFEYASQLADILSQVTSLVTTAKGTMSNLANLAISPFEASRMMVATCNGMVSQLSTLITYIEANPYPSLNASTTMDLLSFGQRLAAAAYATTIISNARSLRRTAILRRSTIGSQIENQLQGLYKSREGDTLMSVSLFFYGSPYEWRRLMMFNDLPTSELAVGTLLMIPRILTGDRSM